MIQIIEDDLVTCHIITALLKRMRYGSCVANTGAEALEQLRTRPIDLVIADMVLPDMHGLQLLEQKHSLPYLRDIPVLCCTAHADIETVDAAMGFGTVDFVKKPIVIQAFSARVNRAIERAPVRWESWRDMSKRLGFYGRTIEPMLVIAQQVLRDLDDALAQAQQGYVNANELNAMVSRARGAALNVGAIRTVHQFDHLWTGAGWMDEIEHLRAALVIELAGFDEAIQSRATSDESSFAVMV
jgi:DNA-binding response OmpR family regulator